MIAKGFRIGLAAALLATTAAAPAPTPAAPAQAQAPRPAIWLLADEDTKIYLFGTIHILPPGFKWRSAALDRVVDGAGELVVETYIPPGEEIPDAAANLFLAEQPTPILERVPADKRAALKAAIEAGTLPIEAYDALRTWAAAMLLGLAELLGQYGVKDPDEAPGVEDVLEEAFRNANKPIGSVEDPVAVLRSVSDLPDEVQTALLLQTLEELPGSEETSEADDAAWVSGNFERMAIAEGEEMPSALYDVLLRKRNAAWTQWLVERLKRPGTVLFAVGAGHLAGPDSVQRMLAARGLDARRVE